MSKAAVEYDIKHDVSRARYSETPLGSWHLNPSVTSARTGAMSVTSPRHQLWADEVEAEEEAVERMAKGDYSGHGDWHPGLEVQRGQAPQRLDLTHGFVRSIVRACNEPSTSPSCSFYGPCAGQWREELGFDS